METPQLTKPVVLLIYNRPGLTKQVFECIAEARPKHLLVVADGPKNEGDRVLCHDARDVVSDITWDCKVDRLYSESNLGCGQRVSSGLDWVFSRVN